MVWVAKRLQKSNISLVSNNIAGRTRKANANYETLIASSARGYDYVCSYLHHRSLGQKALEKSMITQTQSLGVPRAGNDILKSKLTGDLTISY